MLNLEKKIKLKLVVMKNNVFLIIVAVFVMACSARRTIIRTTKTTAINSKNVSVVAKPLLPPVIKKELEIIIGMFILYFNNFVYNILL